jgi:peptidylprolyl isomerase
MVPNVVQPMRRRTAALAVMVALAVGGAIAACGGGIAQPTGTIPAACKAAEFIPGTKPPGTDAAGSTLAPVTVEKPTVNVPVGPLPTELKTTDIKVGDGAEVKVGDQVTVNYVGIACTTGKEFDSSYGKDPATFPLSGVIKGWQEGLIGMKVGGRREIVIPGDKAYTDEAPPPSGAGIGHFEPLFFVVDLIKTEVAPTTTTTTVPATTTTAAGTESPGSTAAQASTTAPTTSAPGSTAAPTSKP